MKKTQIALLGAFISFGAFAQTSTEPIFLPNYYSVKISPNGKWMGSMTGGATMYNIETGESFPYQEIYLGLGNTIADNGLTVGSLNDIAKIMSDGRSTTPVPLREFYFSEISAITRDATRITGIVNNPQPSETSFIPFYCDLDEDGTVGEVHMLPYPELDFFNCAPQFVTAVWISDDGHTIIGQVLDWRGDYEYPIIYEEDANGEWKYSLPTKQYFNPEDIDIPFNPWLNEPVFPDAVDFMDLDSREIYEEELANAVMGWGEYPDPLDYMTQEQVDEFIAAIDAYNEWFYSIQDKIDDYLDAYYFIVDSSPNFNANEMALHPNGEFCAFGGGYITDKENRNMSGRIFKFSGENWDMEVLDIPINDLYPSQILSDGTMVACTPMMSVPTTYLQLPGQDEFIYLADYLQGTHPTYAAWIEENLVNGCGLVSISDDMEVYSGGILFIHLNDLDEDSPEYDTYIFGKPGGAKVNDLQIDGDTTYTVYNMQGILVMKTKDINDVNALPKDIYLINGKKFVVGK